jgi:hypothetical protein
VHADRRPDSAVVTGRRATPARDDVCVTVRDPRFYASVSQPLALWLWVKREVARQRGSEQLIALAESLRREREPAALVVA